MTKAELIYAAIAAQFANILIASRHSVAADSQLADDAITDAATSRYRQLMIVARDAVALYQQRTRQPGIPEDVIRQVNGKDKLLTIIPAQPAQTIDHSDVVRMAEAIQSLVCAASAASAEADGLCLQTLRTVHEG